MIVSINTTIYSPAAIQYSMLQLKSFADLCVQEKKEKAWDIEVKNIQSPWDKNFEKHFKNLLLEVHMNMKTL